METKNYRLLNHAKDAEKNENSLELQLKDEQGNWKTISHGFAFRLSEFSNFLYMIKFNDKKEVRYDVFEWAVGDQFVAKAMNALEIIEAEFSFFYLTEKGWFTSEGAYVGKIRFLGAIFGDKLDKRYKISIYNCFDDCFISRSYLDILKDEKNMSVVAEREDGLFDIFELDSLVRFDFYKVREGERVSLYQFDKKREAYRLLYRGQDDTPQNVKYESRLILHRNKSLENEGKLFIYDEDSKEPEVVEGKIYLVDGCMLGVGTTVIGLNDDEDE